MNLLSSSAIEMRSKASITKGFILVDTVNFLQQILDLISLLLIHLIASLPLLPPLRLLLQLLVVELLLHLLSLLLLSLHLPLHLALSIHHRPLVLLFVLALYSTHL